MDIKMRGGPITESAEWIAAIYACLGAIKGTLESRTELTKETAEAVHLLSEAVVRLTYTA